MKRCCSILLVIALLFSGCSFSAGPASVPTQDTQLTQVAGGTEETNTTDVTQSNVDLADWDSHHLLSLLPKMEVDATWEVQTNIDNEVTIFTEDLTVGDVKGYAQTLVNAGFCLDQYITSFEYLGDQEEYGFLARDTAWNIVKIICLYAPKKNVWESNIVVTRCPTCTSLPEDVVKNDAAWDSDALRAVVQAPPTEYWSPYPNRKPYTVDLPGLTIDQVRAYADELRAAGFVFNQREYLPMEPPRYVFDAQNAEGYTVQLKHDFSSASGCESSLIILPPGETNRLFMDIWVPKYLPEPEDAENWTYSVFYMRHTFNLYGMDYQEVLSYIEEIKQATLALRWKFEQGETWVQDEAAQYIECEIEILEPVQGGDNLYLWTLIYDPSNTDHPCSLVRNY